MTNNNKADLGNTDRNSITLGVLSAVEEDDRATQRAISRDLGIALGLTNAYLKRCIRKGFIKVRQIPTNRYAYYLTPTGFAEKSRLTGEYLTTSFNFFRTSREQCSALFDICHKNRWNRIALAGFGDLAEIATLCIGDDRNIEILGIIKTSDDQNTPEKLAGLPIVNNMTDLAKVHAVIVTDIENGQKVFDAFSKEIPPERVLTPPLLKVSRALPRMLND